MLNWDEEVTPPSPNHLPSGSPDNRLAEPTPAPAPLANSATPQEAAPTAQAALNTALAMGKRRRVNADDKLGKYYLAVVRPTLDRQLAVAGLRLAKLLNDTLQ